MTIVEYQNNIAETTNATLDFLNQRPALRTTIFLLRLCCVFMVIAFILKAAAHNLTVYDLLVVVFAFVWLFWQRSFNAMVLRRVLTRKKINLLQSKYNITAHKLWWQNRNNKQPMQQTWKQVKYIYQNKDGYIIPSPGIANSGKFVWLPKRGFVDSAAEQRFLELMQAFKIKIKFIARGLPRAHSNGGESSGEKRSFTTWTKPGVHAHVAGSKID